MTETIKNNKLIADFLGLKTASNSDIYLNSENIHIFPHLDYARTIDEFEFHSNWNWLMFVVEKIEMFKFVSNFVIATNYVMIETVKENGVYIDCRIENMILINQKSIDILYKTIVQFIKWYNEEKDNISS
jgi:hypothetical protein